MIGDEHKEGLIRVEENLAVGKASGENEAISRILKEISQLSPDQRATLLSQVLNRSGSISIGINNVDAAGVYQFNLVDPGSVAGVLEAVAIRISDTLKEDDK